MGRTAHAGPAEPRARNYPRKERALAGPLPFASIVTGQSPSWPLIAPPGKVSVWTFT